jgi:hypothetical protein
MTNEGPSGTMKTGKLGKDLVLHVGGLGWASNQTCKNIILAAPQMALNKRLRKTKKKMGAGTG